MMRCKYGYKKVYRALKKLPLTTVAVLVVAWLAVIPVVSGTAKPTTSGHSVSHSGKYVFRWKQIGVQHGDFPVFRCFLERRGKPPTPILGKVEADGEPRAKWSAKEKYLIVEFPQQVEIETIIYSLERSKQVFDSTDLLVGFSSAEKHALALEDRGDDINSPAWLRVLDLETGKEVKVARVSFGDYGEPSPCQWLRNSDKFAFIDMKGNVWGARALTGLARPSVSKWKLVSGGHCSDLRYVPGNGMYFVQKVGKSVVAYYSRDLRSVKRGTLLPMRKARI